MPGKARPAQGHGESLFPGQHGQPLLGVVQAGESEFLGQGERGFAQFLVGGDQQYLWFRHVRVPLFPGAHSPLMAMPPFSGSQWSWVADSGLVRVMDLPPMMMVVLGWIFLRARMWILARASF